MIEVLLFLLVMVPIGVRIGTRNNLRGERHIRGARIEKGSSRSQNYDGGRYRWGRGLVNFKQARTHFLAVGSTGSGKTVSILLLMRSVLGRITENESNVRALVYDSKTDFLPRIRGCGVPEDKIIVLNPFDERAAAWDMAADIKDASQADDVASRLVPSGKSDKDPYFTRTAQRLLAGMIEVYIEKSNHWTLRDILLGSSSTERLRTILESSAQTRDLLEHFTMQETFRSVKSTLDSQLRGFREIAASWHRSERLGVTFSVDDWLTGQSVLVLGNSLKSKAAIKRINQLLFSQIAKTILDEPGYSGRENWIFLDEVRELGALDCLEDLMTVGRSKGAAVVLGFQSVSGFEDAYGSKKASEIIGCAKNLAILHINNSDIDSQKWASSVLGQHQYETTEINYSKNSGRGGTASGKTVVKRKTTERLWLPSQFATELPETTEEQGMKGVFRIENRFSTQEITGDELFSRRSSDFRVPDNDASYPNRIPRPACSLPDWDYADIMRLNIPELELVVQRENVIKPPCRVRERLFQDVELADALAKIQ